MALSDLAVFSEHMYSATTEIIAEQVELFNAASRGTLILSSAPFSGDFSDTAFFASVQGLVRRRNPYATGAVAPKSLEHLIDTMVKVGAGTPPLEMDPSQFRWILQNPELAAAMYALQLAPQTMQDMLEVVIGSLAAAMENQGTAVVNDITGATAPGDKVSHVALNNTTRKFGDRGQDIVAWVMHSGPMYDLYGNALTNNESLFSYGTVNIASDAFGRVFVISDTPGLISVGSPNEYKVLGLTQGAGVINMNNDYDSNTETKNGDENLRRTMQAEWSYNVGLKGYTWDKTNGGKAPNNAALFTGSNWDRLSTSIKDTAGVMLVAH